MPFDAAFVGCHYGDAQEFIAELLQSSTEYSLVGWGLDGKILRWSEGARRLFGYEVGEVPGKAGWDALHTPEGIVSGLPGKIAAVALRCGKREGMLTPVRKSGERFSARTVVTPHHGTAGRHIRYLLILREVTYEVPVEQAVERFRSLLESAPDAMMIVDANGQIVVFNSQTGKIFGYSGEELLGRPVELRVPERFRSGHPAHRHNYPADSRVRPMGEGRELFGLRRDGQEFPVEISLSPIESEGQHYTISAVRDVTCRKKAEEKFRGLLESAPDAMVIDPKLRSIALVAVTELAMAGDRDRILAAGFDGYVSKQIDPGTFVQQPDAFMPRMQTANPRNLTILAVDNLAVQLELARSILTPAGYNVITAGSMAEGLAMARENECDLIISDVCKPDGGGYESLQAVQTDPQLRAIPFILLTSANVTERDRARTLAMGTARYLCRPLGVAPMLAEIRACLSEKGVN